MKNNGALLFYRTALKPRRISKAFQDDYNAAKHRQLIRFSAAPAHMAPIIYGSLRRAIAQLFRKNLQLASSLLIMRTCSAALSHLSLQCAETCDDPAASTARRPDCEVADSSWLPVAGGCWRGLPCGPPPAGLQADLMMALVAVIRDLLCEFLSKSLGEKLR